MIRVPIQYTGNSCRSQMAERVLMSFVPGLEVCSAGINPADRIHPKAVQVLPEIGLAISDHRSKNVDELSGKNFENVITVCDHAKETCPVFMYDVNNRLHIRFDHPSQVVCTEDESLSVHPKVRAEIQERDK